MLWFIFAFIAAIATSIAAIIEKKTLIKEHAMEFSAVLAMFTMVLSLPFFLVIDYTQLQILPIAILYIISIPAAVGFLLVAKSIRHMELSSASPLLVLSPGIVAILAFIFLRENLGLFQIYGILLLIVGSYTLETKPHHSLLEPIKIIIKSKYIHYILSALLLYGVVALVARILLFNFDMQPIVLVAFSAIFGAFNFLIMLYLFHDGIKGIRHGLKKAGLWIFLMAIFVLVSQFALANAIKISFVALAVAIKRMSVLFTTIIGGELFHEKNLLRKSIAVIIMIGGTLLIVI